MKKRYLYALLFGIPGCLISLPGSLFVFVDFIDFVDTYDVVWVKSMSDGVTFSILIIFFLILCAITIIIGYRTGRKLDGEPELDRKHVRIAGVLTLLIFAAVFLWVAREVRYQADSDRCGKICFRSGFSAAVFGPDEFGEMGCYCSSRDKGISISFPLGNLDPDTLDVEPIK